MDNPDSNRDLLAQILETQREHLAEYRSVTARLIEQQAQAQAKAVRGVRWGGAMLLLLLVALFLLTTPGRCVINLFAGGTSGDFATHGYELSDEQVADMVDVDRRLQNVHTPEALVRELGKPDRVEAIVASDGEPYERRYIYERVWPSLRLEAVEHQGGYLHYTTRPKLQQLSAIH